MLQWMGGSRRKVNSSRGLKQKRQKQYFEQRKRQQCQSITSSVDNFIDGYNPCRLNQKEKRSLDVLSLHSLSQVAEGCSLAYADGILEVDPFPDKSTKTRTLPKLIDKIVTSVNNAETLQITGSGNISNSPKPRMPEEEIGTSNLYNSTLEGNPDGEELKHASDHQFEDMSVFELIDEDGKSGNKSEEDSEYEAHVAFSMQGLGKVGTETPVNSPQPSRRILSDDQSGLFKAARCQFPQYSCRNIENLLEDHEMDMESMMGNGDVFSNGKYSSSDWGQSWRFGSYGHAEPDFLKYNSTELYDNNPRVKYFDDKENFGDIHELHADFLEVGPRFPDGRSFNEKFDISCENTCFTDIYNISSHEADFTADFSFAKRDQYGRTDRFWDLDFSSQHPKHQLAEDCDFLKSDHSNASDFTANKFINAGAKQSRYSYLKAEDPMDNFSSLSGESCSSSAVKGGGIAGVPAARKTLKRNSIYAGVPSKYQSIREDFNGQLAASMKCIPGQHGECERPREYTRSCDSIPLSPVHADLSEFTFGKTFGHVDDLSCKDAFPSASIHLARHTDLGSSYHSSDKDHLSGLCKPVGGDIYGLLSASKYHFDSHMSFGGCKDDSSVESKCPMNTSSKRSAFGQDFSSSKYFSSFPESGCRKNREGLHQEIDTCVQSSDSTEGSGKHEDKDLTKQRSTHRNAHENNIKGKASHEKEICAGPEGTLSGTPKPLCETHDKLSKKNTNDILDRIIQENDDDTSSFIGLSDNSGSRASEKECRNNTLDLQPQQLDPGTSESEQRSVASEGEISSIEPSYQLMMLETHMLRLLCVKKNRKYAQKEETLKRRV